MPDRKKIQIAEIEQRLLLDGIFHRYQYDFRNYAQTSIKRSLDFAMEAFSCKTISQLQDRVLHDPTEFTVLLDYLTIQVSAFFRDPRYFLSLRREVIPFLRTYPFLKIWIAGCSTGEEVYSMAIMLYEEGLLERSLIYATDINSKALRTAEQGIYDSSRVQEFKNNYHKAGGKHDLSQYYTERYGSIVFNKDLKKNFVFADHSLATDSVFSEMHLVSCRNVLIYFNNDLQNRTIELFLHSLCHRGFLGLGSKESLRFLSQAGYFEDFVQKDRIYRKKLPY